MLFNNVVETPLIGGDFPDRPNLFTFPPPQLHLLLSLNHLLSALMREWEELATYLSNQGLVFEPYHGSTLEVLS